MEQSYQSYSLKEGHFSCQVPTNWSHKRDAREDERQRVYGLLLVGPRSQGVSAKISLRYYAPGNRLFTNANQFLKVNLEKGPIEPKGERTEPVEAIVIAGQSARRFVRNTFEYLPQSSLDTKEIPVTEEYVVLAAKQGFFILSYSAPISLFDKYRPQFEHAVDTFRSSD